MAKIRKGKRKGQEVVIHQYCNDWFTLEDGSVVSPTMLEFNLKEFEEIEGQRKKDNVGQMFNWFYWDFPLIKKRKLK